VEKKLRYILTRDDFLCAAPIILISIFLIVPLAFSTRFDNPFQLVKASVFHILLLLALPFCVYAHFASPRQPFRMNGIILSAALFTTVYAVSTVHSFYKALSTEKFLELLSMMVFFFVMMRFVARDHLVICLRMTAIAAFLTSLYALLQHAGIDFPSISWSEPMMVRTRAIGSFGNPTFLAGYLVVAMPLVLYLLLTDTGDSLKGLLNGKSTCILLKVIFYIITWSAAFAALVLSLTRGAWLAFAISHLFMLFLGFRKIWPGYRDKILAVALIMVFCLGICLLQKAVKPGNTVVGRFMTLADKKDIHTDRLFLWKIGIRVFLDNMAMGTGPGTFPYVFMKYREMEPLDNRGRVALPEACHNHFIEIALSSGLMAVILYLVIVGSAFHASFRLARAPGVPGLTAVLLMSSGVAYLVHNTFLYPTISTDLLWWFILAFFSSKMQQNGEEEGPGPALRPFASVTVVLVSIMILILFFMNMRVAVANHYVCEGKKYEDGGKWEQSLSAFNNAVIYDPCNYRYHLYRGKMLENFSRQIQSIPPSVVDEVVRSYQNAIALNPFDPYSLADLGRFLGYLSDRGDSSRTAESVRCYEKAIAIDQYNPMFYGDLGNVYAGAGNIDMAMHYYRRSLQVYPASALVYVNMATLLIQRKDREGARKYLVKALEIDPGYRRARSMLEELEHSDIRNE
jgi:putative inorganic carbon (HCO3(-)) transporter